MTPSSRLVVRRIAPLTFLAFLLALLFALAPDASAQRPLHLKELQAREAQREREHKDEPLRREQWFYEQRMLPDGRVPANLRLDALRRMQDMMEAEGKLLRRRDAQGNVISEEFIISPSTTQWTPIGPRPGLAGGSVGNVSGRIGAIAVHPTIANIVFLGGAQGGVWRSMDGGMTWVPISDSQASLAIGAIAIDPSNPNIVYVGTGEQTFSVSSYYGAGILKTINALDPDPANISWTQLGANVFAGPFNSSLGGSFISSLVINPANSNLLLAGVQINTGTNPPPNGPPTPGVYCSGDGGNTWSLITSASGAVATEVVFATSSVAYAALGRIQGDPENGIYKSTNANGACSAITFARLESPGTTGLPAQTSMGRIEIAIAPSTPTSIYASVANASDTSSSLLGFFVSSDAGVTWAQSAATPDFCFPQCWYDQVIKVHPNNANVVYAGGSAVPNFFMRSTNAGQDWTPFLQGSNGVRLHVDQHAIAFGPGTGTAAKIYVGNDGGAWSSDVTNPATTSLNWTNLNADLQLTQFYPGMSIHPSDDQIAFGGTQDNSTQRYSGSLPWQIVTCGDGGWTAIDPLVPTTVYATCQNVDIRKSTNSGLPGTFLPADAGITDTIVAFIPPFVIDPTIPQRLYFGTTSVWQTIDGAANWSPISLNLFGSGSANVLTALAVSPASSSVVWASPRASGGSSRVFVATNVGPGTATFNIVSTGLPSRVVTQIVPDPADAQTAYVTYSGFVFPTGPASHVFKTTNALSGVTWTDISGDLPNIPVNDLVVDPDVPNNLYVATDVGVFVTSNAGLNWSTLSVGLPRVAVLSLKLARASRVLRAATHGRGAWDLQLDTAVLPSLRVISLSPLSATAGGASFTLTVNGAGFLNGTTVIRWNGSPRNPTTCSSATQCTVQIPTSDITAGGTAQVSVANGATVSNSLVFVVAGGVPNIANLNGAGLSINLNAGSGNTNITVNGTNFTSTSQVQWNLATTGVTTTFVSSTQLTATVSSSLLAFGGVNVLTVFNPPPGGGSTLTNNNFATVNVLAPAPLNDNFANATPVTLTLNSFTNTVDNSAATVEPNDPAPPSACATGGAGSNLRAKSVWYSFTPTGSGSVTADTIGSNYDTILQVITGNPPGTPVACSDDIVLGSNLQSTVTFSAAGGTTYNFMISAFQDPAAPPWLANGGKTVFNLSASLTAPPYTLATPTGQQTVNAGQSAQYQINVTPQAGGFPSAITFSCTGLPTLSSCSFNPASVTPNANPASTTLTISTTARSAVPPAPQSPSRPWPLAAPWLLWFVAFALLCATFVASRRFGIASRRPRRWRLATAVLPLVLLALLLVLQVSGCGGGGDTPPPPPAGGTPAGTFTVTVTGTSGANVQSTTVSLRVN